MTARIKSNLRILQGYFRAEAFEQEKCVYAFEDSNKIALGAGRLITKLLGGYTQDWAPASDSIGITKFVLFGIDDAVGTCGTQMLTGDFGTYYDSLDPIILTEINLTSFPCLKSADTIEVTTIPVNDCDSLVTPGDGLATMSSDVVDNAVDFCVRVGPGFAASGLSKYYAMAALVGTAPDPTDTNEYVLALEQFPVMVKTSTVVFRFLWTVYI
jgi:hypothetical protein